MRCQLQVDLDLFHRVLAEQGEGFGDHSSPSSQKHPGSSCFPTKKACEPSADPRETLPATGEARREQGRAPPAPRAPKLCHSPAQPPVRAAAASRGILELDLGHGMIPKGSGSPTPPHQTKPGLASPVTVKLGFGAPRSLSAPTLPVPLW